MTTSRQTLSYLRTLFEERGIRPKPKLGQNFLIDLNLLDLLLRSAELGPEDLAVEVGSGTGGLTARLADQAGAVLAIEIDPAFYDLGQETVAQRPNVVFWRGDILKNKNEINPHAIAALQELSKKSKCSPWKLVANLPYAVATPVITNFLISDLPFERMVVTVQWEIAARLIAWPGHKEYGALAVMVQSLAEVHVIRRLRPSVFWPRPKVDSAFVLIRPSDQRRAHVMERVGEVKLWRAFLRDLYVHRRKNLRGALAGWPTGRRDKEVVDRKLAELGLDGTVRAEQLDVEQHLALCGAFADV
jgi:16S rRNA (adenine1518-N6/adenine1519-N6)-dimethyltransferase